MAENMDVNVEVWPVAADAVGLWLLAPDAYRPPLAVPSDSDPHAEVELMLAGKGLAANGPHLALLHSTSWRAEGTSVVVTYIAVASCAGAILDHWPNAQPIDADLARHVGQPPAHGPTAVPIPRHIDVLFHALRHLRFLVDTDAVTRRALAGDFGRHLSDLTPELARMYEAPGIQAA